MSSSHRLRGIHETNLSCTGSFFVKGSLASNAAFPNLLNKLHNAYLTFQHIWDMGRTKKHHGPAPATRMTARRLRPKQAIYYGNKKSPQGPTVLIEETKGPQRDTGTIQLGKGSSTNPEPKASARKRGRPTRTFAPRRGRPKSETNSQNVESSSQNITTPKRGRGRPKLVHCYLF